MSVSNSRSEQLLNEMTKDFSKEENNLLTEFCELVWACGLSFNQALEKIKEQHNMTDETVKKMRQVIDQVGIEHERECKENFDGEN